MVPGIAIAVFVGSKGSTDQRVHFFLRGEGINGHSLPIKILTFISQGLTWFFLKAKKKKKSHRRGNDTNLKFVAIAEFNDGGEEPVSVGSGNRQNPRSNIFDGHGGRACVAGGARGENPSLHSVEGSNGHRVVEEFPRSPSQRQRNHVYAVVYGLVESRQQVHVAAPEPAPTHLVHRYAGTRHPATSCAAADSFQARVPHRHSRRRRGRVGSVAFVVCRTEVWLRRVLEVEEFCSDYLAACMEPCTQLNFLTFCLTHKILTNGLKIVF